MRYFFEYHAVIVLTVVQLKEIEMKLKQLKLIVDGWADDSFMFSYGINSVHSYRGYYDQVAFGCGSNVSVEFVKSLVNSALSQTFVGWKCGEYRYDGNTLCNLAEEGCCGDDDNIYFESTVAKMHIEYLEAGNVCV